MESIIVQLVLEYDKNHAGDTPWMGVWETGNRSLHSPSSALLSSAHLLSRSLHCLFFAPQRLQSLLGSIPALSLILQSYQYQPVAIPFATGICVGVLMGVTCSI